jgi:fumarate reductase subunit C
MSAEAKARGQDRPRQLERPMPASWWLKKRNYFVFMMRELSAVFIGLFAVATILQVRALRGGPEPYAQFMEAVRSPAAIAVATIALLFAILHSITFFMAAGRVLVVQAGEERVPPALIVAGHIGLWFAVSVVFVLLVL